MGELVAETVAAVTAMPVAVVVVIALSAVLGGLVQGSIGFGAAFATVPALAITRPDLLPGAMLVAILPLSMVMLVLERRRLDRPAAIRLSIGRLPGIALGTAIVVWADVRLLTAFIAVVLLAAVAASATGWELAVTPRRELVAGVVSGVTGAATSLGGPPLAILYRRRDPGVMRPTLAAVWSIGIVLALASLWVTGQFTAVQALTGSALGALVLLGLLAGRQVVARVPAARLKAAILWWAGIGGCAALVRVAMG